MHSTATRSARFEFTFVPIAEDAKPWIRGVARFGFWALGFIHVVVGVLALQLAAGFGGETDSLHSALSAIYKHPWGGTLLIVLAAGFTCYAAWRLVQAIWNPDRIGHDFIGTWVRVGCGLGGLIYLGLAFSAVRLVFFGGDGGREGERQHMESMTAATLAHPWGRPLLAAVVVILAAAAITNVVRAWRAKFSDQLAAARMASLAHAVVVTLGRYGYLARGSVFAAAASLFARAALDRDPREAGGMSAALGELLRQPFGRWLLGIAAAGFIAYGLFCWSLIRYRRLPADSARKG